MHAEAGLDLPPTHPPPLASPPLPSLPCSGFWAWTQVFDSKGARRSRSTSAPPPRPQR